MDLDGAHPGGWYGLELGGTSGGRLDFGFSVDWYHRGSREMELLFVTGHGFDPPIRSEVTRFESWADFVPFGVTLRLRLPVGRGPVAPPKPYDDLLGPPRRSPAPAGRPQPASRSGSPRGSVSSARPGSTGAPRRAASNSTACPLRVGL